MGGTLIHELIETANGKRQILIVQDEIKTADTLTDILMNKYELLIRAAPCERVRDVGIYSGLAARLFYASSS